MYMDSSETNLNSPKQGSSLAIATVILIVALGGAYFWYLQVNKEPEVNVPPNATPMTNEELQRELEASGNVDISADMKEFEEVYK